LVAEKLVIDSKHQLWPGPADLNVLVGSMVVSSLILFQLFATGDVDTGGKLTPGVVDTSGKFATGIVNTGGAP
jgi:hypothetical protein